MMLKELCLLFSAINQKGNQSRIAAIGEPVIRSSDEHESCEKSFDFYALGNACACSGPHGIPYQVLRRLQSWEMGIIRLLSYSTFSYGRLNVFDNGYFT